VQGRQGSHDAGVCGVKRADGATGLKGQVATCLIGGQIIISLDWLGDKIRKHKDLVGGPIWGVGRYLGSRDGGSTKAPMARQDWDDGAWFPERASTSPARSAQGEEIVGRG